MLWDVPTLDGQTVEETVRSLCERCNNPGGDENAILALNEIITALTANHHQEFKGVNLLEVFTPVRELMTQLPKIMPDGRTIVATDFESAFKLFSNCISIQLRVADRGEFMLEHEI